MYIHKIKTEMTSFLNDSIIELAFYTCLNCIFLEM